MIKEGILIEFKSGMQYEVIKVFSQNLVDLRACKPQFEWMPDYFPVYYSIELKEYKILSNEPKVVRNNEQKEKVNTEKCNCGTSQYCNKCRDEKLGN